MIGSEFSLSPELVTIGEAGGFVTVGFSHPKVAYPTVPAGAPALPSLAFRYVIPRDATIDDLQFAVAQWDTLPGAYVPVPIPDEDGNFKPDPRIYDGDWPYPERAVKLTGIQDLHGIRFVTISVHPVIFTGATRRLVVPRQISLHALPRPIDPNEVAETCRSARPDTRPMAVRGECHWLHRNVENFDDLDRYYHLDPAPQSPDKTIEEDNPFGGFVPTERPSLEGPPVEVVIITDSLDVAGNPVGNLPAEFQRLADWRTVSGMPTVVKTVGWIAENYQGVDRPEQIRNFLKEAHTYWGTYAVLLGGDVEIVPPRLMKRSEDDNNLTYRVDAPTDVYYSHLDGNWNRDGDQWFAEACGDLYPPFGSLACYHNAIHLWVGRLPAADEAQAALLVNKTLRYERVPGAGGSPSIDYYDDVLLVAGPTSGADTTYSVFLPYACGIYLAEQIARHVNNSGVPTDLTRLYARLPDLVTSCGSSSQRCYGELFALLSGVTYGDFTRSNFIDELNSGHNIVWHKEHSSWDKLGDITFVKDPDCSDTSFQGTCLGAWEAENPYWEGDLTRDNVDELRNGDELSIVISDGSYTNDYDRQSVSKNFLTAASGGAVAYYGKTSSTGDGPYVTLELFDGIFADQNWLLGESSGLAPNGHPPDDQSEQLQQSLNHILLGDPSMAVWTAAPRTIAIAQDPSYVTQIRPQEIVITVTEVGSNDPIRDARVCLRQDTTAYAVAWTDQDGEARFSPFVVLSDDEITITATAYGCAPEQETIRFGYMTGASYISYDSHLRTDGVSGGDDDDVLEAGEDVALRVVGRNQSSGMTPTGGVWARVWPTAPLSFDISFEEEGAALLKAPESIVIGGWSGTPPGEGAAVDSFSLPAPWWALRPEGGEPTAPSATLTCLKIWRDNLARWHLKSSYGNQLDLRVGVVGTVRTEGGFRDSSWAAEGEDSIAFSGDTLSFRLEKDATNDEIIFRAELTDWLEVGPDSVRLGSIPAGDTASALFDFSLSSVVPDRDQIALTYVVRDTSGNWSYSDFLESVHAPEVRLQAMARTTSPGSVRDTLCLRPTVVNLGSAFADSVRLVMTKTAGRATLVTSTVVVTDVAPGDTAQVADRFQYTATNMGFSDIRYSLEIRVYLPDGSALCSSRSNLDTVAPLGPTEVIVQEYGGAVGLRWTESENTDLEGYYVYRLRAGGADRLTATPLTETLAYEVSGLPAADASGLIDYRFAVAAVDFSRNESEKVVADTARVWLPLREGWPRRVRSGYCSAVKVADVDFDGEMEIFATGDQIFAWRRDGTALLSDTTGLFYSPPEGDSTRSFVEALAIGDIDNDELCEVVGNLRYDGIHVLEYDPSGSGSVTRSWRAPAGSILSPPQLSDLDGAGDTEILVQEDSPGEIWVWNADGSEYGPNLAYVRTNASYELRTVAIGDVVPNSAGLEVIQAFQASDGADSVYCWAGSGAFRRWRTTLPIEATALSMPAIGDVDADGVKEVVVTSGLREHWDPYGAYVLDRKGGLYVLNGETGALEDSCQSGFLRFSNGSSEPPVSPPILCDLDGDDDLEVVVTCSSRKLTPITDKLFVAVFDRVDNAYSWQVLEQSVPLPGRKLPTSDAIWTATVADIDGDGRKEILTCSDWGYMGCWEWRNGAGYEEPGWPMHFKDLTSSPTITDLEDDGALEMVVADDAGYVYVFELDGETDGLDGGWTEYGHDAFNTGDYSRVFSKSLRGEEGQQGASAALESGLLDIRPNPARSACRLVLRAQGDESAHIELFDVTGRRVVETRLDRLPRGVSQVDLPSRCSAGRMLPAGLYYVRVTVGEESQTRAVVLLR